MADQKRCRKCLLILDLIKIYTINKLLKIINLLFKRCDLIALRLGSIFYRRIH